jgi:hypothetical protein
MEPEKIRMLFVGELSMTNFKNEFLTKNIQFDQIHDWIEQWHTANVPGSLQDFLGFDDEEMLLLVHGENKVKEKLEQLKSKEIASALRKQQILAKALERLAHPKKENKSK